MEVIKLFKVHENDDCEKLLAITRYLHSLGHNVRPKYVQERMFPPNTVLPTIILSDGTILQGIDCIIEKYESVFGVYDLCRKAEDFIKVNPKYRIQK